MKYISLTKGKFAIVDDVDYERLAVYSWYVILDGDTRAYACRFDKEKQRHISMAREILNSSADRQVDHVNCNGLDNRRKNLRLCSSSQNQANKRKQRSITSSKYKGVSFDKWKQKWRARIRVDGELFSLGFFRVEEQAALAYNIAALKHFGEFARINVIGDNRNLITIAESATQHQDCTI